MSNNKFRGELGENAVCQYLEKSGIKILERNYRKRCGELDIVAADDEYLIIVEVKTRKQGSMVSGFESINWKKQNKIVCTAELYLLEKGIRKSVRFDAAQVVITDSVNPVVVELDYCKDAFDATGKGFNHI